MDRFCRVLRGTLTGHVVVIERKKLSSERTDEVSASSVRVMVAAEIHVRRPRLALVVFKVALYLFTCVVAVV